LVSDFLVAGAAALLPAAFRIPLPGKKPAFPDFSIEPTRAAAHGVQQNSVLRRPK